MTEQTFQEFNNLMLQKYGIPANEIDRPKEEKKKEWNSPNSKP
jgi:hypothetical protein